MAKSTRKPALRLRRITRLAKLPPRKADTHKGDFGRVLIIGGSRGMIGDPVSEVPADPVLPHSVVTSAAQDDRR